MIVEKNVRMQVLPVLDVLGGKVVRGVAGRRSEYHSIVSQLTTSNDPRVVASAIRDTFGFEKFYLADLDGILNHEPNLSLYRQLFRDGFQLLVDAGIRRQSDSIDVQEAHGTGVVVGLETCRTPDDLKMIAASTQEITFSLDLMNGMPRRLPDAFGWADQPEEIIQQAVQSNVQSIIVLDLADVGMETGGSTDALCRFIRSQFPAVHLIAGGGVRGDNDLDRWNQLGVDEVLVASALHDGRLTHSKHLKNKSRF